MGDVLLLFFGGIFVAYLGWYLIARYPHRYTAGARGIPEARLNRVIRGARVMGIFNVMVGIGCVFLALSIYLFNFP